MIGRFQFWLQGWPDKPRPYLMIALGNTVSSARYLVWRAAGGWKEEK